MYSGRWGSRLVKFFIKNVYCIFIINYNNCLYHHNSNQKDGSCINLHFYILPWHRIFHQIYFSNHPKCLSVTWHWKTFLNFYRSAAVSSTHGYYPSTAGSFAPPNYSGTGTLHALSQDYHHLQSHVNHNQIHGSALAGAPHHKLGHNIDHTHGLYKGENRWPVDRLVTRKDNSCPCASSPFTSLTPGRVGSPILPVGTMTQRTIG